MSLFRFAAKLEDPSSMPAEFCGKLAGMYGWGSDQEVYAALPEDKRAALLRDRSNVHLLPIMPALMVSTLLPLFRQQIADGGPLTITDSRMSRFIMTLEEAVRLVMDSAQQSLARQIFGRGK